MKVGQYTGTQKCRQAGTYAGRLISRHRTGGRQAGTRSVRLI